MKGKWVRFENGSFRSRIAPSILTWLRFDFTICFGSQRFNDQKK